MRHHVKNPTVTVIMSTIGCHQDEIGRAIRSFLNQIYTRSYLLIINWHPERLVLKGLSDEESSRIIIHEAEDFCTRPVEFIKYGLKKVCTDTWTVLDDDDWIDTNHLDLLVTCWNEVEARSDKPLRVANPHFIAHYDDGVKEIDFTGWTSALFETLTPSEVDHVYKRFPPDLICGSDTWIVGNSYYDQVDFHLPATFHWTRTGGKHISAHESRPRETTPEGRYRAQACFWRIKLDALNSKLNPVEVPRCL